MDERFIISDLIKALEEIKEKHGDIEVFRSFREPIDDLADVLSVETLDEDDEYLEINS